MSMETDSPVVYHGTSESRFPKTETQKAPLLELTSEEKNILRQCNKESLYYRCLPLMIAGVTATHLVAKKGFIKPHPVWGNAASMTGAAFVGWIVGKFSYKTKCEDKFLKLENSALGDAIRRKRGYIVERNQDDFSSLKASHDDLSLKDPSFSYYPDSDFHSSTGSLNLDVDKNIQHSGFDDLGRPSADRESIQFSKDNEPVKKFTSYEELRRHNREEYERSQRSPSSRLNVGPPEGQRPRSDVNSMPPRRYISDLGYGDKRRDGSDKWDNEDKRSDGSDKWDNEDRRSDGSDKWDNTKLF